MYTFTVHVNYTHIYIHIMHIYITSVKKGVSGLCPPQYQHGYIVVTLDVVPALAAAAAAVTF